MNNKIFQCPYCNSSDFSFFLSSFDFLHSNKQFHIDKCNNCKLLFTNPRPILSELSNYYCSKNYFSHDVSKRNLTALIYQATRFLNLRLKFKYLFVRKGISTILDIGCGTGEFLVYCKKRGMKVCGIEPNPKARSYAILHNKLNVLNTIEELDKNSKFDIISYWHVLEHLPDPIENLKKIRNHLNPNGYVVIAVPNCDSWDARYYGIYWAGYDLPRHMFHFNINTLTMIAEISGFIVQRIHPQYFDAFYISLLSERYMNKRMKWLKAFLNGIKSNISARTRKSGYSSMIFILVNKRNNNVNN